MSFRPSAGLSTLCALLAWLALGMLPSDVQAQVRHCTAPDGTSVFTDRRCADIGASERLPRTQGQARNLRLYRRGCSRNLQDLVYEMTTAIDARDANRLAGVYHWVGASSRGANSVMQRLQAIVDRPLVDIVPVVPGSEDDGYYPSTIPARQVPVALRVEQTLRNGSTPSRTVFALRRHFDCWWITL
jgi:hypothetical protein